MKLTDNRRMGLKKNKMIIIAIALVVGFLWFGEIVRAQTISGINQSSMGNGDSVTINGSGFGSKATASPQISSYDNTVINNNFHAYSVGVPPTSADWAEYGECSIDNNVSYQRSTLYQSDKYLAVTARIVGYDFLRYYDSSDSNYIYFSFWYYITRTDWNVGGGNMKIHEWITGPVNNGKIQEKIEGNPIMNKFTASLDGGQGYPESWSAYWPSNPFQHWHHLEFWIYTGTIGNTDGFYRSVLDGEAARNWSGFGMLTRAQFDTELRTGHTTGPGNPGGYILLDQVYIDSTQTHVFISDKSDITNWLAYSGTAHNEIQVVSAWSNNSITFTVNQGSFSNGTVYLYVVDENGDVSNGYPITFGREEHKADLNDDGLIDMPELMFYIARWKAGDGVTKTELEGARGIWFGGGVY